jgi:hypothetical protein
MNCFNVPVPAPRLRRSGSVQRRCAAPEYAISGRLTRRPHTGPLCASRVGERLRNLEMAHDSGMRGPQTCPPAVGWALIPTATSLGRRRRLTPLSWCPGRRGVRHGAVSTPGSPSVGRRSPGNSAHADADRPALVPVRAPMPSEGRYATEDGIQTPRRPLALRGSP